MIKVIAFDFVGVLVREKHIELKDFEDKLERLFGKNISDEAYLNDASKIYDGDIISAVKNIIDKLYEEKDPNLFDNIRNNYPNIKIVIATNHVSYVSDYINSHFKCDDVVISADIHKVKPDKDFYEYLLDKYQIKPSELLFLDDNLENVNSANNLGINTIYVNKDIDINKEINRVLNEN